jgi:hypothetical protein
LDRESTRLRDVARCGWIGYDVDTWEELWEALLDDLGPTIWALLGRTADDVLEPEVANSAGGQIHILVRRVHRGYPVPENHIQFFVDDFFIDPEDTFCERDWPAYPPVGTKILALDSGLDFRWARDLGELPVDESQFIGAEAAEAAATAATGRSLLPDAETTIIFAQVPGPDGDRFALVYEVQVDCSRVLLDVYSGEVLEAHQTCIS